MKWYLSEKFREGMIGMVSLFIRAEIVDLAKGYHLMTYSPTGVEATAVELQDSARTLCRRNCKLYRLRSA